ncbi:MAG: metallophosphoesterase [Lachnospiraceae bacterium]|nr:metallophosphoesterase [Lachnospiraceae bacterium]
MKILIVSDTHGRHETLMKVLRREEPVDMLIHCGDTEGGEDWIRQHTQCLSVPIVKGNNDFFSRLPAELELDIEGLHVFITHGHGYGVSMGIERLAEEAVSRRADIVMYGHTHRPVIMHEDSSTGRGLWIINPGSLSYPRQEGHDPTYIVMTAGKGREPEFRLCKVAFY